jgi:demethylmenaquinone methyltransferase/2-methoxy-6-polyprenyl-1,4-benzoquinol methylase
MRESAAIERLLAEQRAYYRARAPEYDEWWQRVGRYDRGPQASAHWNEEVAELEAWLAGVAVEGDVLELACGTGWWTPALARRAATLTCVDASPEAIALNRRRLAAAGLPIPRYIEADLFDWTADRHYDVAFFSFWLSHVPSERLAHFWTMVAGALAPGGRAVLIDSLPEESARAVDHPMREPGGEIEQRRLTDGRDFTIVKRFYAPDRLQDALTELGWIAHIGATSSYFIRGEASLAVASPGRMTGCF